ncbi:MAG: ATP-binding protein, partial [Patescibacteria group bacterium]|nr:ATP-binding protein [Patescibacteria group bacterium]
FDIYPIGNFFVSFYVIVVTYAILRYRLMDITVIIRKTTVYFFTIILYLSILLLAICITAKIGDINIHWTIVWMAFCVGAILLTLFDKIKLFFTNLSNKYFFSDIVDYQQTITELAKKLPNEIRLDKVVNLIIKTLMDAMKLNRVGVLLFNSKTSKYEIIKTIGFNKKNGISLITKTFLVNYLKNHKQLVATQELEFLKEAAKTKKEGVELEKLAKDMNHIEAGLCLPLFSADNLIGIIVLGNKISNDAYSKEDLEMLEIVANQAAIAIENALLYKEVEDFNKNLQKKVDEQTKDIKDKTKKLHKLLAMRSEFLNITSHQLRTPVSVIKGVLSMIKEGSIPKEKEKKFLDSAFQRTVKLNEIINDILDASAIDSGKFEIRLSPVAIEPILKKIYQDKNQDNLDLNKKIKLILDLPKKSLPAVLSNEKYLKHILINLINNAFQYTIKGSIAIKAESKKDKVIIKIIDTGIGIDKDDIPKLFQKFGRAKNAISTYTDGSGLGLFIIKKIVDEHKGAKVYIEKTELNKGSVFVLELAIAKS